MSATLHAAITTEALAKAIADWEQSVEEILKGWDCEDEYHHDLHYRHTLQALLDQPGCPLSTALQQRLKTADDRFREATETFPYCLGNWAGTLDADRHWYLFRYPRELELPNQYEANADFRAFLAMSSRKR